MANHTDSIHELFLRLDADGSGFVERSCLQKLLSILDPALDVSSIAEIFRLHAAESSTGTDERGLVNYRDFISWLSLPAASETSESIHEGAGSTSAEDAKKKSAELQILETLQSSRRDDQQMCLLRDSLTALGHSAMLDKQASFDRLRSFALMILASRCKVDPQLSIEAFVKPFADSDALFKSTPCVLACDLLEAGASLVDEAVTALRSPCTSNSSLWLRLVLSSRTRRLAVLFASKRADVIHVGARVSLCENGFFAQGTLFAKSVCGSLGATPYCRKDNTDSLSERERIVSLVDLPEGCELARAKHIHYDRDTRIVVELSGTLVDATVRRKHTTPDAGNRHSLHVAMEQRDIVADLNGANHTLQLFDSIAGYRAASAAYCTEVAEMHATIEDAITGNMLLTDTQLVPITFVEKNPCNADEIWTDEYKHVSNIRDVATALLKPACRREQGAFDGHAVLVHADPGTGKTFSMRQLARLASSPSGNGIHLIPFLVYAQVLARQLHGNTQRLSAFELLRQYGRRQFRTFDEQFFEMAFALRSFVFLFDGVDEASSLSPLVESIILEEIVPMGFRLVVSSRPEGIAKIERYRNKFIIMSLRPLSDEQQQECAAKQLNNNVFYDHLVSASLSRKRHDDIYKNSAFPLQRLRTRVEAIDCPDKMKNNSDIRQRALSGTRFIESNIDWPSKGVLSNYLRNLNANLDQHLSTLTDILKVDRPQAIEALEGRLDARCTLQEPARKVALNLGMLVMKLQKTRCARQKGVDCWCTRGGHAMLMHEDVTPMNLWSRIMANTDELYQVVEHFQPVFVAFLHELQQRAGVSSEISGNKSLDISDLKDPVRVFEKALDDYADRFNDGVLPEACVADILRSRFILESEAVLQISELLAGASATPFSFKCQDGTTATFIALRCKNKYNEQLLDPMRFRNILFNGHLVCNKVTVPCEIQVHHNKIFEYNEDAHVHDHYDFFRAGLRNYSRDMDSMLDRMLDFFEEIRGVPVLFSVLVVVLQALGEHRIKHGRLPQNRLELYRMGIGAIVSRVYPFPEEAQNSVNMLKHIASAAMLQNDSKRTFTQSFVEQALGGFPEELAIWQELRASGNEPPLVKILVESASYGDEAEFQFKHMSICEALFAELLCESGGFNEHDFITLLNDATCANVFRVAGATMLSRLQGHLTHPFLQRLTDDGALALCYTQPTEICGVRLSRVQDCDSLTKSHLQWKPPVKNYHNDLDYDYVNNNFSDFVGTSKALQHILSGETVALRHEVRQQGNILIELHVNTTRDGRNTLNVDDKYDEFKSASSTHTSLTCDGCELYRCDHREEIYARYYDLNKDIHYTLSNRDSHWQYGKSGHVFPLDVADILELSVACHLFSSAIAIQSVLEERGEEFKLPLSRFLYLVRR